MCSPTRRFITAEAAQSPNTLAEAERQHLPCAVVVARGGVVRRADSAVAAQAADRPIMHLPARGASLTEVRREEASAAVVAHLMVVAGVVVSAVVAEAEALLEAARTSNSLWLEVSY